jgi:hypothetical protein
VAELVVVDLAAGLGDQTVDAGPAGELHAFGEERAVASFGRPACAHA